MPASPGQKMVGAYVDQGLATRFEAWARQTEGGTSAALRKLLAEARGDAPAAPARGNGVGQQVGVRFKEAERRLLSEVAGARGTTPANWLRSLALTHLSKRPQWNPAEVEALRHLFAEVRRIGNNVNQIARAVNASGAVGRVPAYQGEAAREAAELVRAEMRRIVALMTGNFDYWGLPDAERPTALPGAEERDEEVSRKEREKAARRPRRRPSRFLE